MTVAWKLDPAPTPVAAERLAALLSLPLSDEPLTDEEREAFEQGERFLASGQRGHTTEEIQALIEQMRRDAAE